MLELGTRDATWDEVKHPTQGNALLSDQVVDDTGRKFYFIKLQCCPIVGRWSSVPYILATKVHRARCTIYQHNETN